MDRQGYSIRRPTHIARNAVTDMENCRAFVDSVNDTIARFNIPANRIVNMDQTDIPFDITAKTTIARRGSRSVNVEKPKITAGGRATAGLACAMDGTKLPSYVIFKALPGKHIATREISSLNRKFPDFVLFTVQENAWYDENVMPLWIEKI